MAIIGVIGGVLGMSMLPLARVGSMLLLQGLLFFPSLFTWF